MKKFLVTLLLIFIAGTSFAQEWKYVQKISFPVEDTTVRPFLCTLDENGRLYVVSSKATTPNANNAIYFADYYLNGTDTTFTKMIDFDLNGDSDTLIGNIGAIRGITTIGNDVVINSSEPYPKTKPNTICLTYYYTDADTNMVEVFSGSGYGSYNHGMAATADSAVLMGISFQGPTHRWYNYGQSNMQGDRGRGTWLLPDPDDNLLWSNQMEPGGPEQAGKDLIRDVALVPNSDYNQTDVPFFTSRNSFSTDQLTGGIAMWVGGTQEKPADYTPARVSDFNEYLTFIDPIPYGIDVDKDGILWVAGIDSTRRWVKGFQVEGVNALDVFDLPAQNSEDFTDPDGAPMTGPCDVVLNKEANIAYVIDAYQQAAFVFHYGDVILDVEDDKVGRDITFELHQNYPNPFNPSTMIKFTVPEMTMVTLKVTDILGREIALLKNEVMNAGTYVETFNGSDLSSGTYFYSLTTGNSRLTKKMLLMK